MLYHILTDALPQVQMLGQIRQRMNWQNTSSHVNMNLLILVRDGDMTFTVDSEKFFLHKDSFLFIPAGSSYQVSSENGCLYIFLHFLTAAPLRAVSEAEYESAMRNTLHDFESLRSAFPYSLPASVPGCVYLPRAGTLEGEQSRIWLLLTECDMYRYEITPNRKMRIDLIFSQVLTLLDASARTAPPAAYPSGLGQILFYIHGHYMEPITLSALCDEFQLSRQYVMRLFQTHLHTTVTRYITRLKLEHAMELLRYSTLRVGEVAEMLGFGSTYYFCRLFRRQFSMTPTEFMRQVSPGLSRAYPLAEKTEEKP